MIIIFESTGFYIICGEFLLQKQNKTERYHLMGLKHRLFNGQYSFIQTSEICSVYTLLLSGNIQNQV